MLILSAVSVLTVVGAVGAVVNLSSPQPSPNTGTELAQGPLAQRFEMAGLSQSEGWRAARRARRTPTPTPTVRATTPRPQTAPTTPAPGGVAPVGVPTAGLPAGTALTSLSGMTITKAGTVIDGADIRGNVVVMAANVVIRRSRVSGTDGVGVYTRGGGSLTLEDTTVTGFDDSVAGDGYTATRVEVTRANSDGFKIGNNVTIQDSWCHDMVIAPKAHSDCGQVQTGVRNATIRRNWFDIGTGDGNSALFLAPDLGPSAPGPLVVENNVLGGGNYTLQCVDGLDGLFFISDITIRGNKFLRNSRYGPVRINVAVLFGGNVFKDNGQAISY